VSETDTVLARCHGFTVAAGDEPLGTVETPVFSGKGLRPDYLIVRTTGSALGGFADVPIALVSEIDAERRRIRLGAELADILRLNLAGKTKNGT
jgi:hypothetical protein